MKTILLSVLVLLLCTTCSSTLLAKSGDVVYPEDMKKERYYRLPTSISISPEFKPDYSRDSQSSIRSIPAGSVINIVLTVPTDQGIWYQVEAITENGKSLGVGYVWSAEMSGYAIEEISPPKRDICGSVLQCGPKIYSIIRKSYDPSLSDSTRQEIFRSAMRVVDPEGKYYSRVKLSPYLIAVYPTKHWTELPNSDAIGLAEDILSIGSLIAKPYKPSVVGLAVYVNDDEEWIVKYPGLPIKGTGYKVEMR